MKQDNLIQEKSLAFAINVVDLYKYLIKEKKEYVISKQLLRSGTSIGANIEEALGGFSDNDFLFKITISYKEARESLYWIKILKATNYINKKQSESLFDECNRLCKILSQIILTLKSKQK